MPGIEKAVQAVGSAAALARLMGVTKMAVSHWRRSGVPPDRVRKIAEFTGVTPHELRPDLYPFVTDAVESRADNSCLGQGNPNHENQTCAHS